MLSMQRLAGSLLDTLDRVFDKTPAGMLQEQIPGQSGVTALVGLGFFQVGFVTLLPLCVVL